MGIGKEDLDKVKALCKGLEPVLKSHPYPSRVEVQGQSLLLWAYLPVEGKVGKHRQQKLNLGHKATAKGFWGLLKDAIKIQSELEEGIYNPRNYNKKCNTLTALNDALDRFKREFFNKPEAEAKPNKAKSTWIHSYKPYFNKLREIQGGEEQELPFDSDLLVEVLKSYKPRCESRRKCSIALRKLAEQERIDLPETWKELAGGQGSVKKEKRVYPKDDEIIRLVEKIRDPAWRWVYGMFATYGLRTHEVFFCHAEDLLIPENETLRVRVKADAKTGERKAYPLHKEWVEIFGLKDIRKPRVNLNRITSQISSTVSRQFKRREIGYTPYDFRHAWAIRGINEGLHISVAASSMGHTQAEHLKTYHSYMDDRVAERAFDAIEQERLKALQLPRS